MYQSMFQPPKLAKIKEKDPEITLQMEMHNLEPSTMATLLDRTEVSVPEMKEIHEMKPPKVLILYSILTNLLNSFHLLHLASK